MSIIDQKIDFSSPEDGSHFKKKLTDSVEIPLQRNQFTNGILEYRKNIVYSKTSKWNFWETKKSYFYDYHVYKIRTFPKDD